MGSRFTGPSFIRITLIVWLITTAAAFVILNRIDGIVHGDLYNYGLRFDYSWAFGYWILLRVLYLCLVVPSILSIIVLVSGLRGQKTQSLPIGSAVPSDSQVAQARETCMFISCPNCKKVFSEPLSMLEFSTGKANLVHVCPYCSKILDGVESIKPEEIQQVIAQEKKEVL